MCVAYFVARWAQSRLGGPHFSRLKALLQISKTHSKTHSDKKRFTTGYAILDSLKSRPCDWSTYPNHCADILPTAYMLPTSLRRPMSWTLTADPFSITSPALLEYCGGVASGLCRMSGGRCWTVSASGPLHIFTNSPSSKRKPSMVLLHRRLLEA